MLTTTPIVAFSKIRNYHDILMHDIVRDYQKKSIIFHQSKIFTSVYWVIRGLYVLHICTYLKSWIGSSMLRAQSKISRLHCLRPSVQ